MNIITTKLSFLSFLFCLPSSQHEDLSPLHIKVEDLKAEIEDLAASLKRDQQLWMKLQGTLIELTQELEVNSKKILKLQTEYTAMQQKKIRLESA